MVWGKFTPVYEKARKKTKNAPMEATLLLLVFGKLESIKIEGK